MRCEPTVLGDTTHGTARGHKPEDSPSGALTVTVLQSSGGSVKWLGCMCTHLCSEEHNDVAWTHTCEIDIHMWYVCHQV